MSYSQKRGSMTPAANAKSPTRNSEVGSIFSGGPLSVTGPLRNSLPEDLIKQEVAQKKLKKRLQLKNLIVTKFKNKYCVSAVQDNNLNSFIE